MYKFTLLFSFLFVSITLFAQDGLERVIVEKYYISDANDATLNSTGGILPIGSTTYRIFLDMLPGFRFQSCYGSDIPEHTLKISTTTKFFNNEDRGSIYPTFNKNSIKNNTVMLDSWVSGGYACVGNLGVLKAQDNGLETIVNSDGILKNNDAKAGIPLTQQDGMIAGTTNQLIAAGMADGDNGLNRLLDNTNDGPMGSSLMTTNGLWGVPGGTAGPDTIQNIVLIGQFTTDGDFSFELNVQVGKLGTVEQYVAKNREGDEKSIPSLIYPLSVNTSEYFNAGSTRFELSPSVVTDYIKLPQQILNDSYKKYEIFEESGALVLSGKIDLRIPEIQVQNLMPGVHFMRIYKDSEICVAKFIKM